MTSVVEICNLALSNIRAGSINALTEGSLQAQVCKLKYDILRDRLLTDAPWQFARRVEPLAVLDIEVFNRVYAYQYPSDCLHINRLILNLEEVDSNSVDAISRYRDNTLPRFNFNQQVEYDIRIIDGDRVITSNEKELRADYRVRIEDPNLYSSDFIMALSYLLSAELAIPIVGAEQGRALRAESLQIYQQYVDSAVANNQNEQYALPPDSEFITVRS